MTADWGIVILAMMGAMVLFFVGTLVYQGYLVPMKECYFGDDKVLHYRTCPEWVEDESTFQPGNVSYTQRYYLTIWRTD